VSFKLSVYLILSFGLALLADLILYSSPITARALYTQPAVQNVIMVSLAVVAWGLFRMYTPTIASIVCLMLEGRDVRKSLGNYLNFNRNTLTYFLLAPIIVYLAFGIFLLLSMMLGTLSIDKYVKIIVEGSGGLIKEDLVRIMIIIGLILDYPAALTINSFFALGEEIGWRGYLFELMGRRNDIRSTVIIGSVWGLWHSTAIILLGFNYPILRAAGIPLFVVFCILLTAPMLKLTTMSSSILPAVSIHGAVNALWRTTLLVTTMSETYGGLGITGIASWLITVVMILFIIKLSSGKA
jgi:membrane protease YdiL (CAAX protease family)